MNTVENRFGDTMEKETMNKHKKKLVKKESKEYKCDFCDVKFLNKSNFTRHKKVNSWEQKGVVKRTDPNDPLYIKPRADGEFNLISKEKK